MRLTIFILFMLGFGFVAKAQSNLLEDNGGFEENDLAWTDVVNDWFYKRWGESTMNTSRNAEAARTGDFGVSISISGTGGTAVAGMAGIRREVTGLTANNDYSLKFHIKAENTGDQEVLVSITDFQANPTVNIANQTLSYQGGSWQEVELLFSTDVQGSDYAQIRFDIDFRSRDDKYYIDDFSLVTTVIKTPQTITFEPLPQKQIGDQDFQLTAQASSGLEISYSSSNTNVATVIGSMVSIIGDGVTEITATQPGNETFAPADAVVQALTVIDPNKSEQSIDFPEIPGKVFGDEPFDLSATASSELEVVYGVVDGPVSLNGSQLSILGAGTATVKAFQHGNETYRAANPVDRSFEIAKAAQVITIDNIPDKGVSTRPFDINAQSTSGLDLEYTVTGPASINGKTIKLNGTEGTVEITALQAGNGNYKSASTSTSFEVVACTTEGVSCFDGVFYVSKEGDDSNEGTATAPFLTIQRAANEMLEGETCIIGEGVYRETINPQSDHVVFKAADGEKVTISAFDEIGSWTLHNGSVYVADLPVSLGDHNLVMYGNKPMNLARWPNKSNFEPFDLQAEKGTGTDTEISNAAIPDQDFESGGVLWFLGKSRWTSWRRKISSNPAGGIGYATLPGDWFLGGSHNPSNGGEYILLNSLKALDVEGEWYVNGTDKKVYFRAPGSEDLSGKKVEVRQRITAFQIDGKTGIEIEGVKIMGGNIVLGNAKNCVIKNCEILYGNHSIASEGNGHQQSFRPGTASIDMGNNATDNVIESNNIQWGSGSGIIVRGTNNIIKNNYIGNFNYLGSYEAPIRLSGKNQVLFNEIYNAGRDAINGGGNGAEIAYNNIHHSNLINDDCGGIYMCCGKFGDTRIHHNWIHDITSRNENYSSYKATGVYLDNTTEDVVVDHNVLWGLEWAGIQINWAGTNLRIYNNTIWSTDAPNSSSMGRWVNGYEFSNVQVYNTLANDGEFHATDEQKSVVLPSEADPFEGMDVLNFMPKDGSAAIDAGLKIEGYTDGYIGQSPDAGAYERGATYWVPGPDWVLADEGENDCNGVAGGSAFIDKCGSCVGGNTGLESEEGDCVKVVAGLEEFSKMTIFPNPGKGILRINGNNQGLEYQLNSLEGRHIDRGYVGSGVDVINLPFLPKGLYILNLRDDSYQRSMKIIIE
ncbi:MAG: right-handed parallel beta-helix repeat-containing protein [Cyclobacteriaceae bacterium]